MRIQTFENILDHVHAKRNADKKESCVELGGKMDCPIERIYSENSLLWTVCMDLYIEGNKIVFDCDIPIMTYIDFYWDKSISQKIGFEIGTYLLNLAEDKMSNPSQQIRKAIIGNQVLYQITAVKDLAVNEYRRMLLENKDFKSKVFGIFTSKEEAEDFINQSKVFLLSDETVRKDIKEKITSLEKVLYAIDNKLYLDNDINTLEVDDSLISQTKPANLDHKEKENDEVFILKSLARMHTISVMIPFIGTIGYIKNLNEIESVNEINEEGKFIKKVYREIDGRLTDNGESIICKFNRLGRLYRLKIDKAENK